MAFLYPQRVFPPFSYEELARVNGTVVTINQNTLDTNVAYYVPLAFSIDVTLTAIHFAAANGTGNYDLGLYDENCSARLASSGTTAMSALGVKTLALANIALPAGQLVYGALALSSASGDIIRLVMSSLPRLIAAGIGIENSALPLPATATPVTPTNVILPLLAFTVA